MKGTAYHGWKFGLPEKFWPVSFDNFFDNPDEIREFGLRLIKLDSVRKSSDDTGQWPGSRTESLWDKNVEMAQQITEKILSCYFNLDFEQLFWDHCDMRFHLIPSFDKDKNNLKNKGWIHRDGIDPREPRNSPGQLSDGSTARNDQLAGLIYLTPHIEKDSGTSLFDMKKDKTLIDNYNEQIKMRRSIFKGDPVSDEEVKEKWEKHRSCFIEKTKFKNIYNRLIMYDSKEFHAANSYYTSKDNRLTLGFFIGGIRANKWPLERIRQVKIC